MTPAQTMAEVIRKGADNGIADGVHNQCDQQSKGCVTGRQTQYLVVVQEQEGIERQLFQRDRDDTQALEQFGREPDRLIPFLAPDKLVGDG